MKQDISSIVRHMKKDEKYLRLRKVFNDMPLFQVPTETLMDEIKTIHRTRKVRFLDSSSPKFIDKVVEASIQDQAVRSRMSEILIQCSQARDTLGAAVGPLKEHLLITYAREISFLRTKDERLSVVYRALERFNDFTSKVDSVESAAKIVIEDVDKAGFSLRRLVDVYSLANRPERTL